MTQPNPAPKRVRVHHFQQMKDNGEPITMITGYDAVTTRIFDAAGIDCILVGDSYGNTYLGYGSTIPVTLDQILVPVNAVARAAQRAFVVADLPFGTYEESPEQAVRSAIQLMKAGANAVKLEGGVRQADKIKAITAAGIPVCAHIGFTPQAENALGGPRVQGRGDTRDMLLDDAMAVQEAGAFMVVLEMVPEDLARKVTKILDIPTIGIGAGNMTSGQVLVWTDLAGMSDWSPRFSKVFGEVGKALSEAVTSYKDAVKNREFPTEEHSFQ